MRRNSAAGALGFAATLLLSGVSGAQELVYRLDPELGVHYKAVMTNEVLTETRFQGMDLDTAMTIRIEQDVVFEVDGEDDTVAGRYTFTALDAEMDGMSGPDQMSFDPNDLYQGMVGQSLTMVRTRSGEVVELAGLEQVLEAMADRLNLPEETITAINQGSESNLVSEQLKDTVQQGVPFLPDEPVDTGDSWRGSVTVFGMTVDSTYTLGDRSDGTALIEVAADVGEAEEALFTLPGAMEIPGFETRYGNLTGGYTGVYEVDEATGLAVSYSLDMSVSVDIAVVPPQARRQLPDSSMMSVSMRSRVQGTFAPAGASPRDAVSLTVSAEPESGLRLAASSDRALRPVGRRCLARLGDRVEFVEVEDLFDRLNQFNPTKGEFETSEAFQARMDAVARTAGVPVVLRGPYNSEAVEYNADEGLLLLSKHAWGSSGVFDVSMYGGAPSVKRGLGRALQFSLLEDTELLGTTLMTNALGASVSVTRSRTTVWGVFDGLEGQATELLEGSTKWRFDRFESDGPLTVRGRVEIAADVERAKRLKSSLQVGFLVVPRPPYIVTGTDYLEPTFSDPRSVDFSYRLVVANIPCVIIADSAGVVLKTIEPMESMDVEYFYSRFLTSEEGLREAQQSVEMGLSLSRRSLESYGVRDAPSTLHMLADVDSRLNRIQSQDEKLARREREEIRKLEVLRDSLRRNLSRLLGQR